MSTTSQLNYPFHVLQSKEQFEVLYKIFQMEKADQDVLEKKIAKLLLPAGGLLQSGLDYEQFIRKIAKQRDIRLPATGTIAENEKLLFQEISQQNLKEMPEADLYKLQQQLLEEAQQAGLSKSEIASISSLATISAAQLSGFGVYLLASSTVGAVTSLVGVTLPFAFYTGMSSVISVAIGPIGLLIAAIPLYKTFKHVRSWDDVKEIGNNLYSGFKTFTNGNYELAEIIFTYFAGLRILKIKEYDDRLEMATNDLKDFETRIKKQQENVDKRTEISRNTFFEVEELKKKLESLQTVLKEHQANTRDAGNLLAQVKKEKLQSQDTIYSIKNAQEQLLK